jgi:galactokinase
MIEALLKRWHTSFGSTPPEVIIRAPGRVNIIGEHTDYNEGWVLPGAMSRVIYLLISKSDNGHHHWIACDLEEEFQSPEAILEYGQYSWARYIHGAISLYAPGLGPLRIMIGGDLPVGAGISSSSALVCGLLYGLQQLTEGPESKLELAIIGSRVEREVIGLQGGIMDQFAIMLCQSDHVMLLDCRTREYRHIRADLPGCQWILVNTKVKHQLIDSDYNQRAAQCAEAVRLIQNVYPHVRSLRDASLQVLGVAGLPETISRRAAFVLHENERVHQMVGALQAKDPFAAGELLKASHLGLRFEYEVSCEELDHLADFANQYTGVYGARMMGGGFGGCIICLLKEEILNSFSSDIVTSYSNRYGFEPEVILFTLGAGVETVGE